ncbi:hypothetical protein NDI56_07220 [Haloarcula sp. S1CR25-12]|uniref:Uncharacterized protein n=1 Tax=Haloarcula saliterrae TaxID=2950534 RepID=A0ABU2FBG5_9EURY|nr:hypothetical protein [Haloarcula sp. S1CR25-12]MDS0259180.1 hypothetical protein [Haloarcula sp. S1CR25-12]
MVADDRGQVLLLGGLAIAIVFLTAIPLSNSLVVSESAASSETVSDIDRTADREASVERGVRALANEMDTSNINELNRSLWNFSRDYTRTSAQRDGVYVNATVSPGDSLREVDRSTLSRPGPSNGNWNDDLVTGSERITEFNFTVTNVQNPGTTAAYEVRISGDSGFWAVRVYEEPSTGTTKVSVDDGTGWSEVPGCTGTTPVTVNITEGTCSGGGTFTTYDASLSGPYTVTFDKSGSNDGEFRFVGSGTFPAVTPGVLNPAVEIEYVGPDTSYERTILVNETS